MKRRLVLTTLAENDISDAVVWYHGAEEVIGDDLRAEVKATLLRVTGNPRQFRCLRRRPEIRRALTRRFPYRIFFIVRPETIIVFRVLHGARHDREWLREI